MREAATSQSSENRQGIAGTSRRPAAREPRQTILLVEDDSALRTMLAEALRNDGYRVIAVENGDDALEWLGPGVLDGRRDRVPALIISDICLPVVSGLEILEGVRLIAPRVPVILITGFGDAQTHELARTLGAERVLDKPFELSELRAAVHRVC